MQKWCGSRGAHTHFLTVLASLAEKPDEALAAPQLASEIILCATKRRTLVDGNGERSICRHLETCLV